MNKLEPIEYKSLQNGLMMEGSVAESRMPLDVVSESVNFHFDRIGCATLRKGLTLLGNSLTASASPSISLSPSPSAPSPSSSVSPSASVSPSVSPSESEEAATGVLGLYEFRDSNNGTNNRIVSVYKDVLSYLSGSAWIAKRSGLSLRKARFTTFLNYLWMVNGSDATAIWDGATGTSFVTSGNASSAPVGKFIENFKARVWITGNPTYPDRIYYSSIPSAEATPVVTWNTDVATGDWIDISPSDGENVTALKRAKANLLVFKQNHIYRITSVDATDPDPKINVGTYSQESVVEAKDGVYFHHPTGFYKYNYDGEVTEISRPVIDLVENITVANYEKVAGWKDGDHVYWSVGNVTINGVSFNNVVARYTISSQVWTLYCYPTQFLVTSDYNDGSTIFQLVGDNAGNILKVNVGKDDNGIPINYSLIHRWHNLDGLLSTEKNITKMLFHHEGGQGTKVSWQKQDDDPSDWRKGVCVLDKTLTLSKPNIKAQKLRLKLSGSSTGEPFIYNGFEIIEATSQMVNI